MPKDNNSLQGRHKTLAFYGIPQDNDDVSFQRMTKFTQMEQSKNPQEYNRKYVDEETQRTDVVAYAPAINYGFDKHKNIPVQDDIVKITNRELLGEDAIRQMLWVDTETGEATKRDYSVIPNSEGGDANVYTYSGTFKATGEAVHGTATSTDGWKTATFTPEESAEKLSVSAADSKAVAAASAVKVSTAKTDSK